MSRRWVLSRKPWRWVAGLLLLGLGLLAILDRVFPPALPTVNEAASVVLAADGTPLRAFADRHGVWRYPITPEAVSPLYLQALVGYEDRWFHRHPGVNPLALTRAAWQWATQGRVVSGGSTLTMQVARLLEPYSRSSLGKLRQMLRALQLEWHLDKREILSLYLNYAPFGGPIQGVEAASWAYLGKSARELSHAEAALLAVLPQAPSRLRPDRHPERAQRARDKVLARLASQGVWSAQASAEARAEPVIARQLRVPMSAALLAERLRRISAGATAIPTTLDASLQAMLEQRLQNYFARLPERSSAALLVVDNATLSARAYVGSLTFADPQRLGHVDMVRALRSPGSTLKPFLYGLAIDDGLIHTESLLIDAPQSFGDYHPVNFDPRFNGPVSAAQALRLSLNVPAVDLLDRVGASRFAARLAHAGLQLHFPRGAGPNLSLILGGTGVSLEALVGAYAALHREGLAGDVRYQPATPLQERRLLSAGAAWMVTDMLAAHGRPGAPEQAFDVSRRRQVAWKTGTSYGFRDAWALGGTAQYTVGVWVGRPDGTPLPGQYGAITALPLLFEVFDSLPGGAAPSRLPRPATVTRQEICWPLGLPIDPDAPELCQQRHQAWVLQGGLPPTLADRDARRWAGGYLRLQTDAKTGLRLSAQCARNHPLRIRQIARWPVLAQPWLSQAQRRANAVPPLAPDCQRDALATLEQLRIEGLADGSVLARPPGAARSPLLRLRALGSEQRVRWLVNGEQRGETLGDRPWEHRFDRAGDVHITALAESGAWDELRLRVLP